MKTPGKDVMNTLATEVLTLYTFDDNPDDTSDDIRLIPPQSAGILAVSHEENC